MFFSYIFNTLLLTKDTVDVRVALGRAGGLTPHTACMYGSSICMEVANIY